MNSNIATKNKFAFIKPYVSSSIETTVVDTLFPVQNSSNYFFSVSKGDKIDLQSNQKICFVIESYKNKTTNLTLYKVFLEGKIVYLLETDAQISIIC